MSGNLPPTPPELLPNGGKAKMLCLPGSRHFSAPCHCLAARHDHGIAKDPDVLDLPFEGCNHQGAGFDHSENLLLGDEPILGIGHNALIGP